MVSRRLLKLQKKGRVLYFDDSVYVLQSRLHDGKLGLNSIVPVGDLLSHYLLRARLEVTAEELHEFVLHVLDEIKSCGAVSLHYEDGEKRVGFFDTRVEHFDKYIGVVGVFDHELLGFLDGFKRVFVNVVRIVEKHIVFRTQFDPNLLWILVLAKD